MDSRLVLPVNTILDGDYRILRVVGSGGFGITYEAEDLQLGTLVAIKEYYPFEFGDRDATMSVRPKSERHKPTFEKGRTNFLREARTLARFEHPGIVRVTRVLETNSTAYMVMRYELGLSFEAWLKSMARPPTQEEVDSVLAPLLDALQLMHAANFLHRDIAPDNIVIRPDGTPVLLDFGAARRAVAEMSRSLTGIVKAGYSPHEQYSSDGRLQGPWSDIYALGGTLYRAVTGKAPEEATLRFDEDHMPPAAQAAKGKYRPGFLAAIDACLKIRHAERPRSVAELRPMLLGAKSQPKGSERAAETIKVPRVPAPARNVSPVRQLARRWPAMAVAVAVMAGAYGAFEYRRWSAAEGADAAEARRKAETDTQEKRRIAALEEARRNERVAAEEKLREERRIAALEETRRAEEKRKEEERLRLAAIPDDDKRAEFVRKIQVVLKRGRCWDGAPTGRSADAQDGLDKFVDNAHKRANAKPVRIELAKAGVGDFESWLRDADVIKGDVCAPKPKQERAPRPREAQADQPEAPAKRLSQSAGADRPGRGGTCPGWMFYNTSCVDAGGRSCTQTPGGRKCD